MALRFAVSLLAALPAVMGQSIPIVPSVDPFYQPPAGFEDQAPGTILKTRKVQASFFGFIPDLGIETHQLLFRTRSINGSAIASATTVFKPVLGAKRDRFVTFHTAYDGTSTICNPSYNYQLFAPQVDVVSEVEMLLLQVLLLKGYIVSSPDYEGPDAAFAASHLEGMVALDSMRAVSQFSDLGFTTKTPAIVGYGYSGAAIAAGWASSLQPSYAPELPIRGWALGGMPANLTGTFMFIDGTVTSGFLPVALNGLLKPSAYGAILQPFIDSVITPYGQGILDYANMHCAVGDILGFFGESMLTTKFQSEGDRLLYTPVLSSILKQTTMGAFKNETPTAPVFMFHSEPDEIIPYSNASALADTWCADGASVNFVKIASGGHITGEILGFLPAFKFIDSAFAGTVAKGCSRDTVQDNSFSPLALGASLEPVLAGLLNALVQLGQKDARVQSDPAVLNEPLQDAPAIVQV